MNKNELINALAGKGYTRKDGEKAVNDVLDVISETLAKGENITILGFGTFKIKEVSEKESTGFGKKTIIPAHKRISFTPGKTLKDTVNK